MKQWVSLLLVLATLLLPDVEARPSEHEGGEGQSMPTLLLRRMFAMQLCSERDVEGCEDRMNGCMDMLYPGTGLPVGAPNLENVCGGDFHCRREAIKCLVFMQPTQTEDIEILAESEPEPEVEAACQRQNMTIFECKIKMIECMDMIQPEPTGIPCEATVCSHSLDSDCRMKYKSCMKLMNAAETEEEGLVRMFCEESGTMVQNCPARVEKCHDFIHPSRDFNNAMKKCFIKNPDCPLGPKMHSQHHDGLMKCMEPALKRHVDSLDSKVVSIFARDSCLKHDNLKGVFMCLMDDCIPTIPM